MQNIYRLLRFNYMLRGHRAKFGATYLAHLFKMRHLAIRFDPVMACNLRCQMCYFSNEDYVRSIKGMFTKEETERLAALLFPRALLVVFGGATEPTLYKNYPELVQLAKRYKVPNVGLTTNGQLLEQDAIEKLIDYGLDELAISLHGTTRETYEKFMVRASFDTLHHALTMLEEARQRRGTAGPQLRINYTVNPENLAEMEYIFERFGRYRIRTLQIRPIMDVNGAYRSPLEPGMLENYNRIITVLGAQAKERAVAFLANTADPTYEETNDRSVILQALHRQVGPMMVWREDFDWRHETYDDFCQKIQWGRYLLRCAFSSIDSVVKNNSGFTGTYSVKYEVTL